MSGLIESKKGDLALIGLRESEQDTGGGGLARPVGTNDPEALAGRQV